MAAPVTTWIPWTEVKKLKEHAREHVCNSETRGSGVKGLYRDDEAQEFVVFAGGKVASIKYADLASAINSPVPKKPAKGQAVELELDTFPAPAVAEARRGPQTTLCDGLNAGHNGLLLLGNDHSLACMQLCALVGGQLAE